MVAVCQELVKEHYGTMKPIQYTPIRWDSIIQEYYKVCVAWDALEKALKLLKEPPETVKYCISTVQQKIVKRLVFRSNTRKTTVWKLDNYAGFATGFFGRVKDAQGIILEIKIKFISGLRPARFAERVTMLEKVDQAPNSITGIKTLMGRSERSLDGNYVSV
ncbi:hypothetical protein ADUPG1_009433 [Aduncisulcus paluster]|uniref:Uncharacterized protein n=1 Tax=Aduncisulcus paluster TaxID=2918883 RepID=A0ABQ5KWU1_9EUKA|nr:hypothetical protein ADUPG1_009433 [Aduncisulcus paluster]